MLLVSTKSRTSSKIASSVVRLAINLLVSAKLDASRYISADVFGADIEMRMASNGVSGIFWAFVVGLSSKCTRVGVFFFFLRGILMRFVKFFAIHSKLEDLLSN